MTRSLRLILTVLICCLGCAAVLADDPRPATSVEAQVSAFLSEPDFGKSLNIAKGWKVLDPDQKVSFMENLQKKLGSTKMVTPTNTADMVVWSRIGSMEFQGHGWILHQDVFIEGGKAAWAIEVLLDVELPPVIEKMDPDDRNRTVSGIEAVVTAYKEGVKDARASIKK